MDGEKKRPNREAANRREKREGQRRKRMGKGSREMKIAIFYYFF